MKMKYIICYNTGAGDEEIEGTLEEAKAYADKHACYTQQDIDIYDESDKHICLRGWSGCLSDLEDQEDPIQFGDFGYYGDWTDADWEEF